MKGRYTYRSIWYELFLYAAMIGAFSMTFAAILGAADAPWAVLVLPVVYTLAAVGLSYLLSHMPASFEADGVGVTFKLLGQRMEIAYASVRDVKIGRCYVKAVIRGDVPHYVETLSITTDTETFTFDHDLAIDMDDAARHPERLAAQFEEGTLAQLCRYLQAHCPAQAAVTQEGDTA